MLIIILCNSYRAAYDNNENITRPYYIIYVVVVVQIYQSETVLACYYRVLHSNRGTLFSLTNVHDYILLRLS